MWLKRTLLLLIILLLIFPAIQKSTGLIGVAPLNNPGPGTAKPPATCSTWFSGQYQQQVQDHLRDSAGFRELLVRTYNQFDYSLFCLPHARLVVAGRNGYLFEEQYIQSFLGRDYTGYASVDLNARLIREIQDSLLRRKIHLLVLFTPGKGWFYPEHIPGRFHPRDRDTTNLDAFRAAFGRHGVNFLDFNEWFLQMKDTSPHLLYPKTGIHWSSYGGVLAADSLGSYLRSRAGLQVPDIVIDSLEITTKARYEDNDMERGMNLLWKIPAPPLTYQHYHFTDLPDSLKPEALFIGDSFYWTWYWPGIIKGMFANRDFLYYNQQVYPQSFDQELKTSDIDLLELVMKQQVVILIQTNAAYGNPGYGFARDLHKALLSAGDLVARMEKRIRSNPAWMDTIRKKAEKNGVPLDEMIRRDAMYMVEKERNKQPNNNQP